MNRSALALFAQRTRIPTSARSIGFCVIWVCITPSLNQPDFWVLSPIIGFSKPDNRTQDILTKSLIQNKPDIIGLAIRLI